MDARHVAHALGGESFGRRVLAPGPGHSAADRSMSVLLDPRASDGFLVTSFAGDNWRDCRRLVSKKLGLAFQPLAAVPVTGAATRQTSHSRIELARQLWAEATAFHGTVVETYLRARGVLADRFDETALRFHPACPYRLSSRQLVRLPTMLAMMVDIRTKEFRGVHRTALSPDGSSKATVEGLGTPKKMLGSATGACVKLSADEDVCMGLHIAEGIETSLACMVMGFRPVWAALSAGAIATFPKLGGVEALTIFVDHDEAGFRSAGQCQTRWMSAGREVRTIVPHRAGLDFADGW